MSPSETPTLTAETDQKRKPRIAIMGEFSAGKSTLCNLLLNANPLPVKVTATQLPPVWISHGDQAPYREDLDGQTNPVDLNRLEDVPLDQTKCIRIFLDSDILELCDLIDMPGISDPNMASDVWQRILPYADSVLWCTHATQAWRQSEAAVCKSMSPELISNSFLLLTRIDKLLTEDDRVKVVKRVRRETQDMFAGLFPISLTEAQGAQDDRAKWEMSGAEALAQSLVDMLHELSVMPLSADPLPLRKTPEIHTAEEQRNVFKLEPVPATEPPTPCKVMPARVDVSGIPGRKTPRPTTGDRPQAVPETALRTGTDNRPEQTPPPAREPS